MKENKEKAIDKSMFSTAIGHDLHNYQNVYGHCPKCNSVHILMDTSCVLTTYPAQYNFKCQECNHTWTDFEKTQMPPITAWPNMEEAISVEPLNYGWICPKCGRVYSPSTSQCLFCGGGNLPNTVYCKSPQDTLNGTTITTTVGDLDFHIVGGSINGSKSSI